MIDGIELVCWIGCIEQVYDKFLIILDGVYNLESIDVLIDIIKQYYDKEKVDILFLVINGKLINEMVKYLSLIVYMFYVIEFDFLKVLCKEEIVGSIENDEI